MTTSGLFHAILCALYLPVMVMSWGAGAAQQGAGGGAGPPPPPSYYWSRSQPRSHSGQISHRSSHIGPVPHLNTVLTEWSSWGPWSKCSRSCNTGVRLRVRHCITALPRVMPGSGIRTSHDQCGGSSTQYGACNEGSCTSRTTAGSETHGSGLSATDSAAGVSGTRIGVGGSTINGATSSSLGRTSNSGDGSTGIGIGTTGSSGVGTPGSAGAWTSGGGGADGLGQVASGLSFRAAQCRQYNNRKVFGKLVTRWLPYTQGTRNPCALVCEGEGAGIVYTFGKVADGTHCTTDSSLHGLCVNGRCLRVSCDGRLGGSALEDQCRVCGGRNTTCTLHKGVFHTPGPHTASSGSSSASSSTSVTRGRDRIMSETHSSSKAQQHQVASTGGRFNSRQAFGGHSLNDAPRQHSTSETGNSPKEESQMSWLNTQRSFENSKTTPLEGSTSSSSSETQVELNDSTVDREELAADQPVTVTTMPQSSQKGPIGYYEVTAIPKGATNLRVTDSSHNFLALREGKKFLLNGDWLIDWPGEVEAAGTLFSYYRDENDSETLSALGPTKSDLSLMILLREDNPGVYYEYWTPNSISAKRTQESMHNSYRISTPGGIEQYKTRNYEPNISSREHSVNKTLRSTQNSVSRSHLRMLDTGNSHDEALRPRVNVEQNRNYEHHQQHKKRKEPRKRHKHLSSPLERSYAVPRSDKQRSHLPSWDRQFSVGPKQTNAKTDDLISAATRQGAHGGQIFSGKPRRNSNRNIAMEETRNSNRHRSLSQQHLRSSLARHNNRRRAHRRTETPVSGEISLPSVLGSKDFYLRSQSNGGRQSSIIGRKRLGKKTSFRKRKTRKKKRRRQKKPTPSCEKCPRIREVKKHFCTSDFVSRVEVLSFDPEVSEKEGEVSTGGRYEVIIHQSFKNTVPLLHKEFIWVPSYNCVCPRLHTGKVYLIMGSTQSSGKSREVRLGLDSQSYTRRFTTRVLDRVLRIRNNEMKYCKKWRVSPHRPHQPEPVQVTNSSALLRTTTAVDSTRTSSLIDEYSGLANDVVDEESETENSINSILYNSDTPDNGRNKLTEVESMATVGAGLDNDVTKSYFNNSDSFFSNDLRNGGVFISKEQQLNFLTNNLVNHKRKSHRLNEVRINEFE